MKSAKIAVRTRLGEGVSKLLIGIERLRLENLVVANNGVRDVISVGPAHRGPHGDGQLGRRFARQDGVIVLGHGRGIERYGFCLPMDDCLAQAAIDFGGRNWIVWEAEFNREKVGDVPTEMFYHFFKSFSDAAKCNLNIKAEGQNEHHKIEAIFKVFAKAIKMAVRRDVNNMVLPSTKGVL